MSSAEASNSTGLPFEPTVPPAGILFGRGLRLVHDVQTQRCAVCLGGLVIDSWADGDTASQRLAIARLVNGQLATAIELAEVFSVHRNTVGRIGHEVEAQGAAGALPRKRGPRTRHKATAKVLAVLRQALAPGWSSPAAQREVRRRTGVQLSRSRVYQLLQQLQRERLETLPLALEETVSSTSPATAAPEDEQEMEASVSDSPRTATLPDLAPGEAVRSRYLGLALFYPALEAVGLLALAGQVYQLTGVVRFGVREFFLQLFSLAVLQEPTIERAKRVLQADLGVVLGCPRAACVMTLRRKLAALVEKGQAAKLGVLLARHWLEVGLLNASFLYVDGHVKLYSGKRHLAEVWNSQRRMPLPGIEQYFVNDLRGRPLLVVSQDVSGNLAKSLPTVVEAVRKVLGERHFTVIFDRGGYDGGLFSWLVEQGLDFITYQRGDVALARDQFQRHEVRWEGRRERFWLAEDTVTVADSGPWRRIVLRTGDGHQTPILTSLGQADRPRPDGSPKAGGLPSARVVAVMLARWRQENFFKYARAHLGLDALVSSAVGSTPEGEAPNPARKPAEREVQRLRAAIRQVQVALGQTVARDIQPAKDGEVTPKPKRRTADAGASREVLLAQLQALETELGQARRQLAALPKRVPLSSLPQPRQTIRPEPKLLADVVKVAAYNAQVWLADRLAKHYTNPYDRHDLLRSFAQLSGTMTREADGRLHIRLDPPNTLRCARALQGLCEDLNQLDPHFPGTSIPVFYEVAMHHLGNVA